MVIIPFIMGIYYSFTDWTGLNNDNLQMVWFDHYRTLLTDVKFFYSFSRTVIYSILNIVFINLVAFGLALLVTQKIKLRNLYRAGFFMPNLIGGLVLGYIWQFIFNRAIVAFGGIFAKSLLVDGNSALFALIIVVTWQYAGYIMMIYIAAIQNIPQDLIEASKIDGASAMQRLQTITFPLVAQAFTVAMFLTLVTSFKQFDTVVSLSDAGPAMLLPQWIADIYGIRIAPAVDSLNFIAVDIYKEAFSNYNMALGQAKAIIFFIILLVISLVQVNYNKKREVEL
ncbi:sugar ABC transporter permease [Candidatus Xianfuyuplasma coldseepsis]|uniref:Sugar ABC transporter permease n=2 Tax=Candidatus Xianfuyuplasma coldseepsis TaxID=2782163 RepID=A0A7L7KTD7_9MOLU|nr:sugar ABC transporter permease [Xianfuyuplasma coldseepsis]